MSSVFSDDTPSSESATLEPTIAGKGQPDKEGEALVLPEKATVVLKKSKRGKKRAEPGTTKRGMAELDETPKKKRKSRKIPDNRLQLKNPPEWEMLVLVETGLDTSVVIPPSTETELT